MSELVAILGDVPLFHELAAADLGRIAARARLEDVAVGTRLIEEGSAPSAMYIVVGGEFAVTKRGPAGEILLNTCTAGELLGELSVLEDRPRTASVTATTAARVVVLDTASLHDLLRGSLSATLAILRTIAARLGNTESVLRQHDMLAGLGRIAAGLAHELNNPAAAVKRGAVELAERLAAWESLALELRGLPLDDARLREATRPRPARAESTLERARRERALDESLAARGIERSWELAPALAALGWDDGALAELFAALPADTASPVLRWIETATASRAIASDIATAASRISELVHAVRTHSHLGGAPVRDVDIHAGLDDTLALLRHRLGEITVRRDYAADLPRITAYAGELNQVWTNLVDNALHAMGSRGELAIVTRRAGPEVVVEVIDSGPGIPPALQADVWKPFFTTKPVGEGTGLGLHLAYNVVVRRHRGRIELESRPGHTCFRVALPISFAAITKA